VDKPSNIGGEKLLDVKEGSDVSCNLLFLRESAEYLESRDALFCPGVSEVSAPLKKDLEREKTE